MTTAFDLAKVVSKIRSTQMVNMKRLLSIWIGVLLCQMEIQAKALSLYNDLKTIDEIESGGDGISEIKNNLN